jgi:dihydroorotate dehydrogenase/Pyruvate/2-oxoacid:ferredoxin oxidoreductase delta subunit
MADLGVTLCGIELENPIVVSSGPFTWSAEGIQAAFAAGAAAAATKTIRREPTVNPVPHIAISEGGGLLNDELCSDLPLERWIEEELPALAGREGVLIVNTGQTADEVAELAGPLVEAGADILEVVSYEPEDPAPMVAAAKKAVSIPVLAKLSANWANLAQVVQDCVDAGVDGFTAIDSIGPVLRIDVETGRPLLGSYAWLSGQPIRPIAQRVVADICSRYDLPVVGTGGVGRPEHVVEMIMAGATVVGVHTALLRQGLGWIERTLRRLDSWMDERAHTRLADLRGIALPNLKRPKSYTPLGFGFDEEKCTECGLCVRVCAYQARELLLGKKMVMQETLCRSCGLCVSVCPTRALWIQQG